jgi:hypothetical protein
VDNQDSAPALIFPSVPDDFCPTGNWTDVFQQFVDIVLSNGTINVPGLGDVTPAQIQSINQYLLNLQNQVDVLSQVQVRQGTISGLPVGDSTVAVVFTTAMPSDNYTVSFTPVTNTAGTTQSPIFAVQTGTQSITGFTLFIDNNIASITQVDWIAIHSA